MGKEEKTGIKIVLDTNVLISALLFKGELSKVVELWKKGRIVPLFSRETYREFKAVLGYPKFSLTGQEIKMLVEEEVLPYFEIIDITKKASGICRDPDDDKFIACAVSASANFIVSGDKDLLDLKKYKSVRIINASELLRMF